MARASAVGENAALNGLDGTGNTNVIGFVSLHNGDPGETGANENAATGGYARQPCAWNAAGSSAKTNSGALAFSTAGVTAVSYFGAWTLVAAGSYTIGGALGSSVTAASITVAAGALSIGAN